MKISRPPDWPASAKDAVALQRRLKDRVVAEDRLARVRRVAGVDVAFEDGGAVTRAAVVVLAYPGLGLVDQAVARRPTRFPYVPGLLSFRETPAVLDALERLNLVPDLLLCDGHGLAHPRRFGIACHLGLIVDVPCAGVAKSRLVGTHAEPEDRRGAWTPLLDRGDLVGAALRTRPGTQPIYVSVGHRISLKTAIDYVLGCTARYRLPETTRLADHLSRRHPQRGQMELFGE
ncbi:MAG: deoxyribonuclease V [Alphaproteobacteria bacterium]